MTGKSPEAFRTIGELSEELGVKAHILRYWEEQFPMLQPLKRAGGRRHYRPEDVTIVRRIDRLLNQEGYTIKGAVKAMRAPVIAESQPAPTPTRTDDVVNELKLLRDRLSRALADA